MGQAQSQTQQSDRSQDTQSFTTAVQQLAGSSTASSSDLQVLQQLSSAEKRQLKTALQQQNRQADKKIKQILKQAQKKSEKVEQSSKSLSKQLSPMEKKTFMALPPEVAIQTEKKIEIVLEKKDKQSKKLIHREINKAKNICKEWKKNKKEHPSKPVNPESNRKVTAGKATYKFIDKVCATKKETCKNPIASPFSGHRKYKDSSRKSKIVESICLSRVPHRSKKSKDSKEKK